MEEEHDSLEEEICTVSGCHGKQMGTSIDESSCRKKHQVVCTRSVTARRNDNSAMLFNGNNGSGGCRLLWEFIYQLLQDETGESNQYVSWVNSNGSTISDCSNNNNNNKDNNGGSQSLKFRIMNPAGLAKLWGQHKKRSNMTYEKLSRALRYYYKMNIVTKVPGKRLTYMFLKHPTKIQRGQRGARPHHQRQILTSDPPQLALRPACSFPPHPVSQRQASITPHLHPNQSPPSIAHVQASYQVDSGASLPSSPCMQTPDLCCVSPVSANAVCWSGPEESSEDVSPRNSHLPRSQSNHHPHIRRMSEACDMKPNLQTGYLPDEFHHGCRHHPYHLPHALLNGRASGAVCVTAGLDVESMIREDYQEEPEDLSLKPAKQSGSPPSVCENPSSMSSLWF